MPLDKGIKKVPITGNEPVVIETELADLNNMRVKRELLSFTKMHGCGNDYVYINCFDREVNSPESLSVFLSDRHNGVGGDGMVLIMRSGIADARMRMFNIDGSEGLMCGNAIRCVAKYLYDNDLVKKERMDIETLSGVRELQLELSLGKVSSVTVNMGRAELAPAKVPVQLDGDCVVDRLIKIGDSEYRITCVSMGNPHAVVFVQDVDGFDVHKIGPLFEHDDLFPDRVNTEFIEIIDSGNIKMRVWERGSGETRACGTGSCAAVVAAVLNGYCAKDTDVRVQLPGGELIVRYTDDAVYMTGDCRKVFDGVMEL